MNEYTPYMEGAFDQKAISLSEAYAVQYWTEELGVSEGELYEAVELMGSSPEKVRQYLN